jgi:hypothetical protein
MKNYIEDWFKRAIDKLTKQGQETIVGTVLKNISEENKRTTTSK